MYHGIHSTSFFCGFDTDSSEVRYSGGGFLAQPQYFTLGISPMVFHPRINLVLGASPSSF